jgi:hypothetical protein
LIILWQRPKGFLTRSSLRNCRATASSRANKGGPARIKRGVTIRNRDWAAKSSRNHLNVPEPLNAERTAAGTKTITMHRGQPECSRAGRSHHIQQVTGKPHALLVQHAPGAGSSFHNPPTIRTFSAGSASISCGTLPRAAPEFQKRKPWLRQPVRANDAGVQAVSGV